MTKVVSDYHLRSKRGSNSSPSTATTNVSDTVDTSPTSSSSTSPSSAASAATSATTGAVTSTTASATAGAMTSTSTTLSTKARGPRTNTTDLERPFACTVCGARFRRREHMKRHHVSRHESPKERCPYCNCVRARIDNLSQHIEAKHGIGARLKWEAERRGEEWDGVIPVKEETDGAEPSVKAEESESHGQDHEHDKGEDHQVEDAAVRQDHQKEKEQPQKVAVPPHQQTKTAQHQQGAVQPHERKENTKPQAGKKTNHKQVGKSTKAQAEADEIKAMGLRLFEAVKSIWEDDSGDETQDEVQIDVVSARKEPAQGVKRQREDPVEVAQGTITIKFKKAKVTAEAPDATRSLGSLSDTQPGTTATAGKLKRARSTVAKPSLLHQKTKAASVPPAASLPVAAGEFSTSGPRTRSKRQRGNNAHHALGLHDASNGQA